MEVQMGSKTSIYLLHLLHFFCNKPAGTDIGTVSSDGLCIEEPSLNREKSNSLDASKDLDFPARFRVASTHVHYIVAILAKTTYCPFCRPDVPGETLDRCKVIRAFAKAHLFARIREKVP
jgi:hypothetical protein